jgi:predicted DNA-binding ribbon-helix-helix protein
MKAERIQTGVRMEKRLIGALNQLATESKQNLGELMEELVVHAFEGRGACAWSPQSLVRVKKAKAQNGLTYGVHAYFSFKEKDGAMAAPKKIVPPSKSIKIERVQVGFKFEKRTLKVLKAIAQMNDATPGQVLEEIALHQMEGVDAFGASTLKKIKLLKEVYEANFDVHT